ncbi:hypothetical protein D3C78_1111480 [compost metagenome]
MQLRRTGNSNRLVQRDIHMLPLLPDFFSINTYIVAKLSLTAQLCDSAIYRYTSAIHQLIRFASGAKSGFTNKFIDSQRRSTSLYVLLI